MEASTTQQSERHSFTNNLITISLQLLLWSSLFPLSIQVSFFALSEVDSSLFLTNIICIAAAGTSLLVILIHSLIVRLQGSVFSRWAKTAATVFKVIILFVSCTAVLLWITTVGLGIIFTLARQPTCRPASSGTHEMWRKGRVCVLQRIALVHRLFCVMLHVQCVVRSFYSRTVWIKEDECLLVTIGSPKNPSDGQETLDTFLQVPFGIAIPNRCFIAPTNIFAITYGNECWRREA